MILLGIIPVLSGATSGILRTGTATFSMEALTKADWTSMFGHQMSLVLHMVSCCFTTVFRKLQA